MSTVRKQEQAKHEAMQADCNEINRRIVDVMHSMFNEVYRDNNDPHGDKLMAFKKLQEAHQLIKNVHYFLNYDSDVPF